MFLYILLFIITCLIIRDTLQKNEDGYFILDNLLPKNEIQIILTLWANKNYSDIKSYFLSNEDIKNKIKSILGEEYVLIDYTYIIEDSAIHTYHRDYTSSKYYNNLENPSYTMILYLDNSDTGLNLIPGSHLDNSYIYALDKSVKLNFNPGSAILFDADILHAGSVNNNDTKRHCIQFKIIHKDDITKLPHLLNYHVLINRPNNKSSIVKYIETSLTRHFPIFLDLFQETIKTSFTEDKSSIQKLISSIIFSNKDFYKPIRI